MSLTTGTGLSNQAAVIDAVRTHLLADGWTSVINDGTIGANNKEVWLHVPAAQTKNGINITHGMQVAGNDIDHTITYLTPTEALLTPPGSPATRNSFYRVLGCPNLSWSSAGANPEPTGNLGDVYPSGYQITSAPGDLDEVRVDKFNQGANYLRHWIFTPNNSPLGASEVYFICVVEVATGVFRTFGAGEGIKLGSSGWTGGLWVDGSAVRSSLSSRSRYFGAADTEYNGFNHEDENAYVLNFNSDQYVSNFSPQIWNPWMFLGSPWTAGWNTAVGMGQRALGQDYLERSPSNFSGQAIRVPSRLYCMNLQSGGGDNRMRPLMEIPDVFHVNISAMTPGDTIVDDTENFLVVPYTSKTGTDNSGNYGFLIRHPSL